MKKVTQFEIDEARNEFEKLILGRCAINPAFYSYENTQEDWLRFLWGWAYPDTADLTGPLPVKNLEALLKKASNERPTISTTKGTE